jgi:alpha-tubulin suppressor-like RCC1 family protein
VWCPENATDAWQEGWPNWFGSRLLRTWNQTYGYAPLSFNDFRYTLETLTNCQQDNQSYASASTEGYVGALLRDIDDSQQDDGDGGAPDCIMDALALGDDEIFTVFRDDDPASLIAFILSFRARYPQHDQDLWSTIENDLPAVNFTIPTPTVTTQPQPCLHMKNGDVATLTVQGNGSLLNYQWRHDGTPIADGFSYLGVTTNALKVTMVNPTVAGLYDCVISTCDNSKSVTSAATRIQYDLPTFARPLVSWGENYEGQVADGTSSPSRSAFPWAHLNGVVEADGGRSFGMARGPDGVVRTWGTGGAGELGNGANQQFTPAAIALNDAIDIAAGFSAGYAVRRNGTLVAWGYNSNGELGTGDQLNRLVPTPTQFPNCVRKVVAGHNHAVALLGDGTVWATGYNDYGIQGTGTFGGWTTVPHQVPALANVVDVAAGSYHTLALLADGTVWSWGYNAFGQLGNGSTNPSASPVQVTGLANIRSIAGDSYNSFAVRTDGQAYGWGDSYRVGSGLGSGATLTPVLIPTLSNVEKIDCGDSFAMALVGDKLKVWGDNILGSPTTVGVFNTMAPPGSSNVPVDVPYVWGLTGFGTGFATVFAYGTVAVTDVPGESDGPIALALRAQPSPARGATTIYYAVPANGIASLRVYDAAGRLVRTLLDEPRPAGRYSLAWDGTSDRGTRSAACVYFVRLATPWGTMNRTVLWLD